MEHFRFPEPQKYDESVTTLSRTCDSPTQARLRANSTLRVRPGTRAIGFGMVDIHVVYLRV